MTRRQTVRSLFLGSSLFPALLSELLEVFFPLAELISTRAENGRAGGAPFVVSVVGSVAVGKSTTARAMRALLALVPPGHRVDVVSTDGFLFSLQAALGVKTLDSPGQVTLLRWGS